jgi:hypothetical protein
MRQNLRRRGLVSHEMSLSRVLNHDEALSNYRSPLAYSSAVDVRGWVAVISPADISGHAIAEDGMPRFFVSYDIKKATPDPHPALLELASEYGFDVWLPMENGEIKRLPNTTLVGSFPLVEEARSAFRRLVTATSKKIGQTVVVEKVLIVKSAGARLQSDKKKPKTDTLRLIEMVKKARG